MAHAALRGRVGPSARPDRTPTSSRAARQAARGPPAPRAWFGDLADAAAATGVPTVVAGLGALTAVGVGLLVTDPERR